MLIDARIIVLYAGWIVPIARGNYVCCNIKYRYLHWTYS